MSGERLQKVLARAGVGSRRACDELIAAGRVRVNGRVAEPGVRVDPTVDVVELDGVPVSLGADLVHLALHKPTGVLTAATDARGRPTVSELVPAHPRIFPVGRLDLDTSGLLLMTNDGAFAERIAHPRYGVPKTYVAEVVGRVSKGIQDRLAAGVELDDGPAHAEGVRVRTTKGDRAVVELVVREGRNRLVRRLLAAVGLEVVSLTRTAIGPVRLEGIAPGRWRALEADEILALGRSASGIT